MKILYLSLIFLLISITHGYRILALFPFPARSHQLFNYGCAKTLARAGHEVTLLSPVSFWKDPPKNFHYIKTNYTLTTMKMNFFDMNSVTIINLMEITWSFGYEMCEKVLAEQGFQDLMNAKGKFDVVIVEAFFQECFMGFAHKLDVPLIQVVSYIGSSWITDSVGAPSPYSYVYEPYMEFEPQMTIYDRLRNTIFGVGIKLARNYIYLPKIDTFMRKNFQDPNMPSISEIEMKTSLLLINNHESFSYAKPGMPNIINVGGIHIEPNKTLPANLKKFMDEAKHGVIYFSMGSNIQMKDMDPKKKEAFFKVFSNLNQRIMWRWDDNYPIPEGHQNILFSPWFPQNDILAHPNLLLFATHGGLLSTIESINKGVPVVGFPIFADQVLNMKRFQAKNLGLVIEYSNITESSLEWAFHEVLNPKYRENAKKFSKLFHDKEKTPQESAVWWLEYIIRNNGATHLRSPGMNLPWYSYYLLDVIAIILVAIYIPYHVLKSILSLLFSQSKTQKIKKH